MKTDTKTKRSVTEPLLAHYDPFFPPPEIFRPGSVSRRKKKTSRRYLKLIVSRPAAITRRSTPYIYVAPAALVLLLALALIGHRLYRTMTEPRTGAVIEAKLPVVEPKLALPELEASPRLTLVHEVKKGESIGQIGEKLGLPRQIGIGLHDAIAELQDAEDSKFRIKAGQLLTFELNEDSDVVRVSFPAVGGEVEILREYSTGSFKASFHKLERFSRERIAYGVVQTSFAAAATKAGVPYAVIDDFVDLFSNRVVFHQDFQPGDRFSIIYREETLDDGTPLKAGPILAAGLELDKGRLVAARYVGTDGQARYFNEKGELLGDSFLRYPLTFSRISSLFSFARFHPVLGINRPHNGVDFSAPIGTPVRSVANGRVQFAGANGQSGIMVRIQHNERYITAYLHLQKIASGLVKGAAVERGQVIGYVGATGLVTGPHLHYSFYDNGKYVDPLKIDLPTVESLTKGTRIEPRYLKRVLFTLERYQRVDLAKAGS